MSAMVSRAPSEYMKATSYLGSNFGPGIGEREVKENLTIYVKYITGQVKSFVVQKSTTVKELKAKVVEGDTMGDFYDGSDLPSGKVPAYEFRCGPLKIEQLVDDMTMGEYNVPNYMQFDQIKAVATLSKQEIAASNDVALTEVAAHGGNMHDNLFARIEHMEPEPYEDIMYDPLRLRYFPKDADPVTYIPPSAMIPLNAEPGWKPPTPDTWGVPKNGWPIEYEKQPNGYEKPMRVVYEWPMDQEKEDPHWPEDVRMSKEEKEKIEIEKARKRLEAEEAAGGDDDDEKE